MSPVRPDLWIRFAAAAAALSLTAAGAARAQGQYPSGYGTRAYTPQGFQLPEGADCSADIARWRAIQDNDYASGNIGLPVYHQIQNEIARAAAVCSAGRDGEARALVASSKARHGYPR